MDSNIQNEKKQQKEKLMPNIQLREINQNSQLKQSVTVNLLTYNLFLRPPLIKNNKDDMKNERTDLFLNIIEDFEVICLQEVFSLFNSRKHKIIYDSMKVGFYYHAESKQPTFLDGTLVDGGLLTISKYPIIYTQFKEFQYGVLSDNIALKGILYTKIYITDQNDRSYYLHLFNTHLQASYVGKEENVKLTVLARINQLKTLKSFIDQMLSEQKFDKQFDICVIAGDYNVDAINGEYPIRFIEGGEYEDIINGLNLKGKQQFHEYDILKALLSNFGKDYLIDTLRNSNNGVSPITFGDVERNDDGKPILDVNGKEIPRETVLTCQEDLGSKQCLDYIMVLKPGANVNHLQTEHASLEYVEGSTMVRPFFTNNYFQRQNITVTQISDHYGVSTTIKCFPHQDPNLTDSDISHTHQQFNQ